MDYGKKAIAGRFNLQTCVKFHIVGRPVEVRITRSRNINEVLQDHRDILLVLPAIIFYSFFDRVTGELIVNGEKVPTSSDAPFNQSPKYFFPIIGQIYTPQDLAGKSDRDSMATARVMKEANVKVAWSSPLINEVVSFDHGDRILDDSEITVVDIKALRKALNLKALDPRPTLPAPLGSGSTKPESIAPSGPQTELDKLMDEIAELGPPPKSDSGPSK